MTLWMRRAAATILGSSPVNSAARAVAWARGHRLVLVYHRLDSDDSGGCEIVPKVPVGTFKAQLQALGEVVDFMTLHDLLDERPRDLDTRRRRPAIALTFDDDLPSHAEHALPVLRELGVPATFFLSGRALHGLGAYWFLQLEALLDNFGDRGAAARLRVPGLSAPQMMLACERDAELRQRVAEVAEHVPQPAVLQRDEIAALAAAGMTIGFHTLRHHRLPDLDDLALEEAVSEGRAALAAVAGTPLRFFAYPHGKADVRSVAAVRRAGFEAAFTGAPQPVKSGGDRHRIGRWEPGLLDGGALLAKLAVRLHRAAPLRSTWVA